MPLPLLDTAAAAAGIDAAFMQPIGQAPIHAECAGTVTTAAAAGGGSSGQREAGGSRGRRRCSLSCAGCHRRGARPVECVS